MWIWFKRIVLALIVFLAVSQIIRPSRANPPIDPKREIHAVLPVDSPVASIFARSCNDCHSNRTVWPWYSQVAPISWLVAYDVRQGRQKMNFSEWDARGNEATQELVKEICTDVTEGEMPGRGYSLLHPEARISRSDVQIVCGWSKGIGAGFAKLGTKE
jgi:hypothetical protein